MNAQTEFQVDMTKLGHKIDTSKLTCAITAPSGKNVPSKIISHNETFRILYTPFEGELLNVEKFPKIIIKFQLVVTQSSLIMTICQYQDHHL